MQKDHTGVRIILSLLLLLLLIEVQVLTVCSQIYCKWTIIIIIIIIINRSTGTYCTLPNLL